MIGIIGAMDIEVNEICKKIKDKTTKTKGKVEFYSGTISGKAVVVAQCGVGKVNAALATLNMINTFRVDAIINIGVAGALDNQLNICDIVISREVVQHDFDTSAVGDPVGYITGFNDVAFTADKRLIDLCKELSEFFTEKMYIGKVATGDQFVTSKEVKNNIIRNFEAYCCEMEGGAIAQACTLNDIPFLIVRSISDKADGSATMSYEEFKYKAAETSSRLVEKLIESI
ncbi:MAG: 5'-methylthioadenosine/adenosylhomocysteine nucleosidase [Lachnospirales bacterium]